MPSVRKIVLPVAGLGKRLRPLTARTPKALLPVGGLPLLSHILREAEASGIKEAVLIVNPKHRLHFKRYLSKAVRFFPGLKFHVRFQGTPGGNGHAIIQAADVVRGEPFAVRFCDDLIVHNPPNLAALIGCFEKCRAPVLLLERVPKNEISRYAAVAVKNARPHPLGQSHGRIYEITTIVEKPALNRAPSNLTVVGGYILTSSTLKNLERIAESLPIVAPDALPLAVALQVELIVGNKCYGWEFPGKRLDCGTIEGLSKAEAYLGKVGGR